MQVYTNRGIKSGGQLSSHLPNAEYRGLRIEGREGKRGKETGGFILIIRRNLSLSGRPVGIVGYVTSCSGYWREIER
jgi:hypothetical protein